MTTPIPVVCSNFTEIGLREVGETMRCFIDNNSQNSVFDTILRPFGGGRQKFAEERVPVKFRPNRFRFAGVIPKKRFRTIAVGLPLVCIGLI